MNWFDAVVVSPCLGVIFGLLFAGPLGAIGGFVGGVVVGALGRVAVRSDADRIDELEREVAVLRSELEDPPDRED